MRNISGGCISAAFYRDIVKARNANKPVQAMVQRKLKNGKWGVAFDAGLYGDETPEDAVARMTELNPGHEFRLAE